MTAGAAGLLAADSPLTVGQVIERIQKNLGVPWRTPTVDTLKAGTPDTPVQGIATTMMATFDVLQRAAKAGRNFVITHEPTFYNHEDTTTAFSAGPRVHRETGLPRDSRDGRPAVSRQLARPAAGRHSHRNAPDPRLGALSHGRKSATAGHARDLARRARRRCPQAPSGAHGPRHRRPPNEGPPRGHQSGLRRSAGRHAHAVASRCRRAGDRRSPRMGRHSRMRRTPLPPENRRASSYSGTSSPRRTA